MIKCRTDRRPYKPDLVPLRLTTNMAYQNIGVYVLDDEIANIIDRALSVNLASTGRLINGRVYVIGGKKWWTLDDVVSVAGISYPSVNQRWTISIRLFLTRQDPLLLNSPVAVDFLSALLN